MVSLFKAKMGLLGPIGTGRVGSRSFQWARGNWIIITGTSGTGWDRGKSEV